MSEQSDSDLIDYRLYIPESLSTASRVVFQILVVCLAVFTAYVVITAVRKGSFGKLPGQVKVTLVSLTIYYPLVLMQTACNFGLNKSALFIYQ